MNWYESAKSFLIGEAHENQGKISLIRGSAADNIDFYKAIQAHVMWKKKLQEYVDGVSSESLDSKIICLDNRCDLGRWIHNQGRDILRDEPFFILLQEKHLIFHHTAANVVELVKKGKKLEAQIEIDGEYSAISKEVIAIITKLHQMFGQNDGNN